MISAQLDDLNASFRGKVEAQTDRQKARIQRFQEGDVAYEQPPPLGISSRSSSEDEIGDSVLSLGGTHRRRWLPLEPQVEDSDLLSSVEDSRIGLEDLDRQMSHGFNFGGTERGPARSSGTTTRTSRTSRSSVDGIPDEPLGRFPPRLASERGQAMPFAPPPRPALVERQNSRQAPSASRAEIDAAAASGRGAESILEYGSNIWGSILGGTDKPAPKAKVKVRR